MTNSAIALKLGISKSNNHNILVKLRKKRLVYIIDFKIEERKVPESIYALGNKKDATPPLKIKNDDQSSNNLSQRQRKIRLGKTYDLIISSLNDGPKTLTEMSDLSKVNRNTLSWSLSLIKKENNAHIFDYDEIEKGVYEPIFKIGPGVNVSLREYKDRVETMEIEKEMKTRTWDLPIIKHKQNPFSYLIESAR